MDTNPSHVEPPPIMLINEKSTVKSDGDYVKLNLRRDPKSSTSDIYELGCLYFTMVNRFFRAKFPNDPCSLGNS